MELPLESMFIVESKAQDSTIRIRVSFWKVYPGMTGQSALGHWRLTFPPWAGGGTENQRIEQEIYTNLTSCSYPF